MYEPARMWSSAIYCCKRAYNINMITERIEMHFQLHGKSISWRICKYILWPNSKEKIIEVWQNRLLNKSGTEHGFLLTFVFMAKWWIYKTSKKSLYHRNLFQKKCSTPICVGTSKFAHVANKLYIFHIALARFPHHKKKNEIYI